MFIISIIGLVFCIWLFINSYKKLEIDENLLDSSIIRASIGIFASFISLVISILMIFGQIS